MNTPLAVHSVQGMFVGLLVLRILGDNVLASRWKDLPDVFVDLLFNGLDPTGRVDYSGRLWCQRGSVQAE